MAMPWKMAIGHRLTPNSDQTIQVHVGSNTVYIEPFDSVSPASRAIPVAADPASLLSAVYLVDNGIVV